MAWLEIESEHEQETFPFYFIKYISWCKVIAVIAFCVENFFITHLYSSSGKSTKNGITSCDHFFDM